MNTTIQVEKKTLEKLKRLKKTLHADTYNDLINVLIKKAQNIPDSMFGADKGKLKHFSRGDRIEFREY